MRLLLWAIAVGALLGTGRAVLDQDRATAVALIVVAAGFGAAAHIADWRSAR